MNRALGASLIFAGCALVAACASQPTPSAIATPAGAPVTITLKPGDRTPASEPTLLWEPATVGLKLTSTANHFSASADVVKKMVWTEQEAFQDVKYEYQDVYAPGTCYKMVCSSGSGKSEAWNAFYSAKQAQKPAALAAAIQGIGESSAKSLIASGYFKKKPTSWEDFSSEINRAADSGVIQKSAATQVLNAYRSQNAVNLGYGADSCRDQAYSCQTWQLQLVAVPFTNYRSVTHEKPVENRHFDLDIDVDNAVLMSNESESLSFQINENGQITENTLNGTFNRYAIASAMGNNGRLLVKITGVQRVLKDLSSNIWRADNFILVSGMPTFVVYVDSSYIPTSEDPNSQLVVDYTVRSCDLNWLGACKMTSAYNIEKTGSAPITTPSAGVAVDIRNAKGKKAWVEYTISRRNSRFFNDHPTYSHTTDSLKIK